MDQVEQELASAIARHEGMRSHRGALAIRGRVDRLVSDYLTAGGGNLQLLGQIIKLAVDYETGPWPEPIRGKTDA